MVKSRLEQLYKFLEEKPGDSFTIYAIALENIKLNHINEAESLFRSIVENDPDFLAVYYQLGKLNELKNFPKKAIDFYLKGMRINILDSK